MIAVLVLAKAPVAGHVKTRLCPPYSPVEAATLAEAALRDTLAAVAATRCARRVLVVDGETGPWLPPGFEVLSQRGGALDARLAGAFADAGAPALLIGMDTPQVTPTMLEAALERLADPGNDAVIGPASDGGYWAIGLRHQDRRVFLGVPMSTTRTCAAQLIRLERLGLCTAFLPTLLDVDHHADAAAVADLAPHSHFAQTVRAMTLAGAR